MEMQVYWVYCACRAMWRGAGVRTRARVYEHADRVAHYPGGVADTIEPGMNHDQGIFKIDEILIS